MLRLYCAQSQRYRNFTSHLPSTVFTIQGTQKIQWRTTKLANNEAKPRSLLSKYLSLAKARLGLLVVATTAAGYLLAPNPIIPSTLLMTTLGTSLAIGSANAINQYIEVDNDILMRRTANRVLPTGDLSLPHALGFGIVTGVTGSCLLALYVNEITALLALGNIFLYTLVYTPLKRVHWRNTWVGAVVGAVPPVIGWVGNTGGITLGAILLFYILFIWQIPHFLSLSWPLKSDYARAGYRMLINSDPEKLIRLTVRYCYFLLPVGPAAVWCGLTTPFFLVDSTLLNLWLIYRCNDFVRTKSSTDARKTFFATLYYLTLLLVLLLFHKKKGYSISKDEIPSNLAPEIEIPSNLAPEIEIPSNLAPKIEIPVETQDNLNKKENVN